MIEQTGWRLLMRSGLKERGSFRMVALCLFSFIRARLLASYNLDCSICSEGGPGGSICLGALFTIRVSDR